MITSFFASPARRLPAPFLSLALVAAILPLGGCLSTAATVVTAPVKAAAKVVDWSTTSQSEADRNLGRKVRREQEAMGRAKRAYDRLGQYCGKYPQYQQCYKLNEPLRPDERYYAVPR